MQVQDELKHTKHTHQVVIAKEELSATGMGQADSRQVHIKGP